VANELGLPLVVKPSREGSTIGLTKVTGAQSMQAAYLKAAEYDDMVMAEEFMRRGSDGLDPEKQTLPFDPHRGAGQRYDYQRSILRRDRYFCRPDWPPAQERRIPGTSLSRHPAPDCEAGGG